jgi:hypothetical protein
LDCQNPAKNIHVLLLGYLDQLLLLVGHAQDVVTLRVLVPVQTLSRSSSGERRVLGCAGDDTGI